MQVDELQQIVDGLAAQLSRSVALTTRCSGHATHRGVRVIAVDPPATFPLDLVWRPSPKSHVRPAVQRVIDVALGTARQLQWIA